MALKIRFGLRSLLLLFAVVCIFLGYWTNRAQKVRTVISEIERLGGSVGFSDQYDETGKPLWAPTLEYDLARDRYSITEWIGPEWFYDVVQVDLRGTFATDEDIKSLQSLPLSGLYIDRTQVTDGAIVHLKQMPSLRRLGIDDTKITESGFLELQAEIPLVRTSRCFDHERIIKAINEIMKDSAFENDSSRPGLLFKVL